jgi:tRNA-dihydrouridine synthase
MNSQLPWFSASSFPLYLAPMAGVSDKIFRQLCKERGCGCSGHASRDLSATPHPLLGLPLLATLALVCIRNTPLWTTS